MKPFACLLFCFLLTGPALAQEQPIHSVVNIDVLPQSTALGENILRQYVADAKRDPDVSQVSLLTQTDTPNHFLLSQVMPDKAAYDRHKGSEYTKRFRAALYPTLGSPWDERLFSEASNP